MGNSPNNLRNTDFYFMTKKKRLTLVKIYNSLPKNTWVLSLDLHPFRNNLTLDTSLVNHNPGEFGHHRPAISKKVAQCL